MGKSTEQRIWDRVKMAQLILLAAAFLLFLGGCGREGEPAEAATQKPGLPKADTLVFLSGGVDIENFGSAAWTGGSVK